MMQNKYKEAIEILITLLKEDNQNTKAYYRLSKCYL